MSQVWPPLDAEVAAALDALEARIQPVPPPPPTDEAGVLAQIAAMTARLDELGRHNARLAQKCAEEASAPLVAPAPLPRVHRQPQRVRRWEKKEEGPDAAFRQLVDMHKQLMEKMSSNTVSANIATRALTREP